MAAIFGTDKLAGTRGQADGRCTDQPSLQFPGSLFCEHSCWCWCWCCCWLCVSLPSTGRPELPPALFHRPLSITLAPICSLFTFCFSPTLWCHSLRSSANWSNLNKLANKIQVCIVCCLYLVLLDICLNWMIDWSINIYCFPALLWSAFSFCP